MPRVVILFCRIKDLVDATLVLMFISRLGGRRAGPDRSGNEVLGSAFEHGHVEPVQFRLWLGVVSVPAFTRRPLQIITNGCPRVTALLQLNGSAINGMLQACNLSVFKREPDGSRNETLRQQMDQTTNARSPVNT